MKSILSFYLGKYNTLLLVFILILFLCMQVKYDLWKKKIYLIDFHLLII
jgi:hypothetical protein